MKTHIELDPEQVGLLDRAMRLAYIRLIDTDVARAHEIRALRDPLILPMVLAITKGETDVWRLARRGIFAACAVIASEALDRPACGSATA